MELAMWLQHRHSWSTTHSSQRLKYLRSCSYTRNEATPKWEFLRTVAGQRKAGTTCLPYSEGSLLPSIAMYSSPHARMEEKKFLSNLRWDNPGESGFKRAIVLLK